jgi:HPt (histidine-containing phosphotransfer) domain-containing protein
MNPAQDRLRDLIVRHCETLRANADLLAALIAGMRDSPRTSGQLVRDALHIAHQIAGAGGSIGFGEISALASDIEHALEPIVAANGTPTAAQQEKLDALLGEFRKVAAELRPELSTLHGVDIAAAAEARRRA